MHFVSEVGEVLMFRLVAWELLGRKDFDPKELIRALPLADLDFITKNVCSLPQNAGFLSTGMIQAEMLYRLGRLKDDWRMSPDGAQYTLEPPTQLHSLSPRWVGAEA